MTDDMRKRLRGLGAEEDAALRRKLGLPEDLTCLQVFDFFMADDEDDRMHMEARPAKPSSTGR